MRLKRRPTVGTAFHAAARTARRRLQLPAELSNPHDGAQLDFRDPPLEVDVLALAGVSLEGGFFLSRPVRDYRNDPERYEPKT